MASLESQPRNWKEKTLDVGFSAFSLITLPVWVIGGVGALAGANFLAAGGYGLLAASDAVTIKETFQDKKSILNPSYWVNKVFRGRNRLGGSTRSI